MKRFLHALAALWPKRRENGSPPLAETGLLQHLTAVLRMDRRVVELRSNAHQALIVSGGSAELTQPKFNESQNQPIAVSDVRVSKTVRDPRATAFTTNADYPIQPSAKPIGHVLARLYLHTAPKCIMGETASPDATRHKQTMDRGFSRSNEAGSAVGIAAPAQPTNLPPTRRPMPLLTILIPVIFMCLMAAKQVSAQAEPAEAAGIENIKPLQIGDTIPEELWHLPLQVVNHPEGKKTITLNDYRGKLIILDFWATWCGSCIAAMTRIHELEKENAADMVVIPVTYEQADKVSLFLSANKALQPLGVYSAVSDKALRSTFPHRGIPHYAWISPNGEVATITTSERVSEQNIKKILDGRSEEIPVKKDIDADRPLFLSNVIEIDDLTHYSVFTKGYYDGLGSGNRIRKGSGVERGRAVTNSSILRMYEAAMYAIFRQNDDRYNPKRLVLKVKDTSRLTLNKSPSGDGSYLTDNLYNYELIVPVDHSDSLYVYMLQDLNRYTAYHGRMEVREIKCLVLTGTGDLGKIRTKGAKPENTLFFKRPGRLINRPLSYLVTRLNGRKEIPLPVVDETGFLENVDLQLSGNFELDVLKNELRLQNLDLVEEYRELNMFILTDKQISPR